MNLSKEELLLVIERNDEQHLIEASRELLSRKVEGVQDKLLEILKNTENAIIRNGLALLLSDEKNLKLFDVVVDLLKDKKTINSRGTLLYSLSGYDCTSILTLLVDFVITGNFEVSNQAFNLISEIDGKIPESVWIECKAKIEDALQSGTSNNVNLLKKLHLLFEENE